MRTAYVAAALLAVFALSSCVLPGPPKPNDETPAPSAPVVGPSGYRDYVPIDPLPWPQVTYYDANGTQQTKAWPQLTAAQRRDLLANTHAEVSVGKVDTQGNVQYLVAKAAAETGDYVVVMDYTKYMVVDTPTPPGSGRVGVGMRVKAQIHTMSANVDLSSLFKLGVAASTNQLQGNLSVDIIGIGGADDLILLPSPIDESSVQKSLESLAGVKSRMLTDSATLTPQLMWVKPAAGNITAREWALRVLPREVR